MCNPQRHCNVKKISINWSTTPSLTGEGKKRWWKLGRGELLSITETNRLQTALTALLIPITGNGGEKTGGTPLLRPYLKRRRERLPHNARKQLGNEDWEKCPPNKSTQLKADENRTKTKAFKSRTLTRGRNAYLPKATIKKGLTPQTEIT